MVKKLFLLLLVSSVTFAQDSKKEIDKVLTTWHQAAAKGDFNGYFSQMSPEAIFIGTDATENWGMDEFKAFAKPYFDKGKAWDFKALTRNIYLSPDGKTAWFDELLDTWMKLCRGSGVMQLQNGKWKIVHYVLSVTVPNDNIMEAIKVKEVIENNQIEKLKKAKQP